MGRKQTVAPSLEPDISALADELTFRTSVTGGLQTLRACLSSGMDTILAERLEQIISAVDEALSAHESGKGAPYSVPFLRQVRGELTQMRDQWPSFPFRFGRSVVDWPQTELGSALLAVGDLFERRRKRTLTDG